MSHATEMLESHPAVVDVDEHVLAACVEACLDAAQSTTACADACLSEEAAGLLVRCTRTCLDCADIAATTARLLSRVTETDWRVTRAVVEACALACRAAAEECERWEDRHGHCRICVEVCRRAEESCAQLLEGIAAVQ